jgi:hypothetical protein
MSNVGGPPAAASKWEWVETAGVVTVGVAAGVALLIAWAVTQEDDNWLTQLLSFVGSLWSTGLCCSLEE